MKKILSNKLYMTSLLADLISNFGDILYYIAMLNYVLLLEKSELALSIITISETIPVFTGLFTGMMADKISNKLKVIKLTLLFRMSIYLIIGFVVRFEPALWVVIVISIFNFFSDISAQLENGLFIPLRMRMTKPEDRQEYFAFSQSASMTCIVFFQIVAGILVGKMSFSSLAFVNSGTFIVSLLIILGIRTKINKLFENNPLKINENVDNSKKFLSNMISNLKDTLTEFKKIGDMKLSLIIAPIVNAIGVAIPILVTLIIKTNSDFVIKDAPLTLALVQSASLVGSILGGLLIMSVFKEIDLNTTLVGATAGMCAISFAMHIQSINFFLISMFITGLLAGAINPKVSAMVMNTIPEEKLATVGGGIGTYFQIGMILMRVIISGLILIIPVDIISLMILVLSIILALYGVLEIIRRKNENNN